MQRHLLNLSTGTIEVTDRVARTGWELQEKAEEGAYGSSTIDIDDPDMDFVPEAIRSYSVIEDESEATDNVLYGGYTGEQAVGRLVGGGRRPLKRVWSITLYDRNSLWNRRTMVGSDCARNAENDTTRMQWLLGTSEASFIDDDASYVSTASPAAMDKVDYRGQYLNQIVDDCAQHTGKNWWLQLQESGSGRSNVAWYGKDSLSAYSSPLYLTNDRTAVSRLQMKDGTSLVWPISKDAELTYDPSRVYTGVYLRYGNGKAIYRLNPAVNDPDSPLYHVRRDFVADYPNVKTKAKAIARATRLLNDMAEPGQVITCDVELPKGKATMLRAGMRVPIKVTHWDPYTDWRWVRVLTCTVSPISAGQWYKLSLELAGPGTAASGPGTMSAACSLIGSAVTVPGTYPGNHSETTQSPGNLFYVRPGVDGPWTPSTGFVGTWTFPIYASDAAGDGASNRAEILIAGAGTLTVTVADFTGSHTFSAHLTYLDGITERTHQSWTGLAPGAHSFTIPNDEHCYHKIDIGDDSGLGGKWQFVSWEWAQ